MKIVALAGGVGGAKLIVGLAGLIPTQDLTVVVNTGDDFRHFGLAISPDIDTICYSLAGQANPETGWGVVNESHEVIKALRALNGPDWFLLGDKDIATHLERTRRLSEGQPLSKITRDLCALWGVHQKVLPMSDRLVQTVVKTVEKGDLSFQEYFVRYKCNPKVLGFTFKGIRSAKPAPGVLSEMAKAHLIVICPSNPWVSIDPILALPGIKELVKKKKAIAVSPIIGGRTVKGPAAKMFLELGITPSALAVAKHYKGLLSGFVFDSMDKLSEVDIQKDNIRTMTTNTLMTSQKDKENLARVVLDLAKRL